MVRPIQSIVVGVADADGADPVLRHALELARRVGATLHVVHAYTAPDSAMNLGLAAADVMAGMPPVPVWNVQESKELEDAMRARLRAQLPAEGGSPAAVVHVEAGPPQSALARVADGTGAAVVAVGASHRHGFGAALLGSTAERTLREVGPPTLVLRRPLPSDEARILLTTDLSPRSAAACAAGLELARSLLGDRVTVRCLHVAAAIVGDVPPIDEEEIRAEALQGLTGFLATLPAPGVAIEPLVRVGSPADEIVAEAAGWPADLVVVATHRRTGLSRLLLGSVAETVVRELPCDALAIHD